MAFSGRYQPLRTDEHDHELEVTSETTQPTWIGNRSNNGAPALYSIRSESSKAALTLSDDEDNDEDELEDLEVCDNSKGTLRTKLLRPLKKAIKTCTDVVRANAGLLLVASSQAFFALMNVAVKKLNSLDTPVPTLELIIVRMGITYICCISYMYWRGVPDPFLGPKPVRFLLVFRGFSGFFGLFGIYYSLQYLSLSDATVLTFLAPLTTAFAGCLFLGEVFRKREALAGVASLLGVILIARPEVLFGPRSSAINDQLDGVDPSELGEMDPGEKGTSEQRLIAVGVALVGVLGATGAYTSLRAIGKRAHTLHSLTFFSSMCVVAAIVGMIATHEPIVVPMRISWLAMLVMIGIFGFLAQVLLTMGLQRETAGRGAMAIYVQIIFATILERIFFHTVPSALSITGTLIIIASALFVAITKQREQQPPTKLKMRNIPTTTTTTASSSSNTNPSHSNDTILNVDESIKDIDGLGRSVGLKEGVDLEGDEGLSPALTSSSSAAFNLDLELGLAGAGSSRSGTKRASSTLKPTSSPTSTSTSSSSSSSRSLSSASLSTTSASTFTLPTGTGHTEKDTQS